MSSSSKPDPLEQKPKKLWAPKKPNVVYCRDEETGEIFMSCVEQEQRELSPLKPILKRSPPPTTNEDEDNAFCRKATKLMKFFYEAAILLLFWMFLPIALPFCILRAVIHDCRKFRRVLHLTLNCMIVQLQMIFEMVSCIQESQSPIDQKLERMGRAFNFLNMFNPVHWVGMFLYYADHTRYPRASIVDQGNQTADSGEPTPQSSKQQTRANALGMSPHDEKSLAIISEDDEQEADLSDDNLSQDQEASGSSTPAKASKGEKKVQFKSQDDYSSNQSSQAHDDSGTIPADDESF